MLRIVCIAAAMLAASGQAQAANKAMPIDFIGEWCLASRENKMTSYSLPSWTEGGHCTGIISIDQYGFYRDSTNCETVKVRLTEKSAPSGTTYIATIAARCRPDGPITPGELRTFEFSRYKGHLSVTEK